MSNIYTDDDVDVFARAAWAKARDQFHVESWEAQTCDRRDLYRDEVRAGLDAMIPAYTASVLRDLAASSASILTAWSEYGGAVGIQTWLRNVADNIERAAWLNEPDL